VEHFASHDYLLSLFKGDGMSKQEKDALAARLSEYTGLSAGYIDQLGDRVTDDLFFTHLLADRNRQLGRYDSRFTGIAYAPGTDKYSFDPSAEAVTGPFTATFNDYVRRELRFESELPYETIANVWPWNMKQVENRYLNVAEDLRRAMSRNPYLKVWVCCGHYDLATPYFASKYTVDQMNLDPAIRHNIRLTYYDSGHMLYINKQALQQFKSDFRSFAHDAMVPDSGAVPSALP
ncbi:MAG TPA: hypothetical protein V6C72_10120, partial [Chroococcales cyanobacterium]